jgi:hypothetical protein
VQKFASVVVIAMQSYSVLVPNIFGRHSTFPDIFGKATEYGNLALSGAGAARVCIIFLSGPGAANNVFKFFSEFKSKDRNQSQRR